MLSYYDIFCSLEQPAKVCQQRIELHTPYMKLCMQAILLSVFAMSFTAYEQQTQSQSKTFYHHSFELFYAPFINLFSLSCSIPRTLFFYLFLFRLMSLFLFFRPFSPLAPIFSVSSNAKSVSSQFFGTTAISHRYHPPVQLSQWLDLCNFILTNTLDARFPFELMAIFSCIPAKLKSIIPHFVQRFTLSVVGVNRKIFMLWQIGQNCFSNSNQ